MTTIETPAKLVYMLIADILCLLSVDAEAQMDYQAEGFLSWPDGLAPLAGTTVADIMPRKVYDIEHDTERYDALRASMLASGQTVPVAVNMGYLLGGAHRVAVAVELGWPGMWTTSDHEASEDRAWNAANPRHTFA